MGRALPRDPGIHNGCDHGGEVRDHIQQGPGHIIRNKGSGVFNGISQACGIHERAEGASGKALAGVVVVQMGKGRLYVAMRGCRLLVSPVFMRL